MSDAQNDRTTQRTLEADVAIIGGGPVGALLAILLGKQGKTVALVERWTNSYDAPRAVTYDHEIARILATLGINSENDPAISYHDELYYWRDAAGEDLQIVDWQSTSASGWRVRYWFNQPELEKRLTRIASDFPTVSQIRGYEAVALDEGADRTTLTLRRNPVEDATSDETVIVTTRYVVGADGANSFVRDALGIENEDKGYFFDWLILDTIPHFDYVASRDNEPAQWQLCDPRRPTTVVPGGPGPDPDGPARRRWEFMLLLGEKAADMQKTERAWQLLKPWGLTPKNATLERSAVYRFQARWAPVWNVGRTLLAGDSAHLMPPFAGEGMCAGLRDAFAIGWRLNAILEGTVGPEVLDSYTSERIEHVKHYIEFSQALGRIICITDPAEAAARDRQMKVELAERAFKPVPTDICRLGTGLWCSDTKHAGELSVQGVVEASGMSDRFDQVFGQGWVILGLDTDPLDALTPEQRDRFALLDGRGVRIGEPGTPSDAIDVDGTYGRWLGEIGARYVLLRPDFYVAATAATSQDLRRCFDEIASKLHLAAERVDAR